MEPVDYLRALKRRWPIVAVATLIGAIAAFLTTPAEPTPIERSYLATHTMLVADPTLLVCDEPTGDLDREKAEAILELLQLLNRKQGKTIVMVTHDPRAADHASRRLYVDKGTLVEGSSLGAAA